MDLNLYDENFVTPTIAIPRLSHDVLFAIGGFYNGSPINLVEAYDTRADRWIKVNSFNDPVGPRAYHGCAVIRHKVYCIGGRTNGIYHNKCSVFDVVEKSWTEVISFDCFIITNF